MKARLKNLKYENRVSEDYKQRNIWWEDRPDDQLKFELYLWLIGFAAVLTLFILLVKFLGEETVIWIVRMCLSAVGMGCLLYPLWFVAKFIRKYFRLPETYKDDEHEKIQTND